MLKYLLMLILASNSPRRKQLLALGGWNFQELAPEVDENVLPGEGPVEYVRRLAQSKARQAIFEKNTHMLAEAIILAADTAVIDLPASPEGAPEILGKPIDAKDAERMLRRLRGRVHQVCTGLVVLRAADGNMVDEVVATDVRMRCYSDGEIRDYIGSGDPLDKAGAYAIQHPVFRPVQNLQGCYANVMGLPVCHAARLLAQFDCPPSKEVSSECQHAIGYPCEIFLQASAQASGSGK